MRVPRLEELDLDIFSAGTIDQLTPSSRPSLTTLLDLRTTIGPQSLSLMPDFQFFSSVFPLYAVSDLISVILSNRDREELSNIVKTAEEIQSFLQKSTINADLEQEFDVAPYLIFFKENSTKVITNKKRKNRPKTPQNIENSTIKHTKNALIRLLQAIEPISTLLNDRELLPLLREITEQSYLYQSKKALIEQVISAKTVAQYLLSNLPLLPERYKSMDFGLLFRETAAKASRKRVKNKRIQTLNQVIMLGNG